MAATVRTPDQVLRDRALLQGYYCRRMPQWEMAAALNAEAIRDYTVTRDMVKDDLEQIRKEWLATRDLAEDKEAQLARIDELERTYWRAWEASLENKEVSIQEMIQVPASVPIPIIDPRTGRPVTPPPIPAVEKRQKASVRKEGQTGNPAYLVGVQWCIEQRNKMLGLLAPSGIDITSTGNKIASIADLLTVLGPNPVDQAVAHHAQNGNGNGHKTPV